MPSFQAALRTRKSVKLGAAGGGALQALSASSSACDDMDGGSSDDDHMATCSDDVATDAAGRMGAGHMGADMAGSSGAEGRRQRSQQRRQKQQQRQQPQKLLVASKPAVVSMRDGKVVKVPAKQLPLVLPVSRTGCHVDCVFLQGDVVQKWHLGHCEGLFQWLRGGI